MIFEIKTKAPVETIFPQKAFLLVKGDLYEKSGRLGYTDNILDAGWFDEDYARSVAKEHPRHTLGLLDELRNKGISFQKIKFWTDRLSLFKDF